MNCVLNCVDNKSRYTISTQHRRAAGRQRSEGSTADLLLRQKAHSTGMPAENNRESVMFRSSHRDLDRPSLLMQYLNAGDPGTVICRGAVSYDHRYDGTSQELLRSFLKHYRFMPIPNQHFVWQDHERVIRVAEQLRNLDLKKSNELQQNDAVTPNPALPDGVIHGLEFYHKFNPFGVAQIESWSQAIDIYKKCPIAFRDWVDGQYFIPRNGPILVVGSPEGFLGFPPLIDPLVPAGMEHATEFFQLMSDCGYVQRFRLAGGSDEQVSGLHSFLPYYRHLKVERGYKDVALIYLGRTPRGRVVVIAAGATNHFGTLAATLVCCEPGRPEVNALVESFIKGRTDSVSLKLRVAWPRFDKLAFPYLQTQQPRIELYPEEMASYSDLNCWELERTLSIRQPKAMSVHRETSRLAKYFQEIGPVSALVKFYPDDMRDDGTARDLIESLLPDTQFFPVPDNPNWGETRAFFNLSDLKDFLDQQHAKHSGSDLFLLDADGIVRMQNWKECLSKKHQGPAVFKQWIESLYGLPDSGPLLIIGCPESFAGWCDPDETEENLPPFATLMRRIGYPNRYQLDGAFGTESNFLDRKTGKTISAESHPGHERTGDSGIIYLAKGPNERDVLVIGGNHWLGTLAGVQMVFAERRPIVDQAVQDYIDGRRQTVELGFKCRRVSRTVPPENPNHLPFPLGYRPAELQVELINEADFHEEFVWNSKAAVMFDDLFQQLKSSTSGTWALPRVPPEIRYTYTHESSSQTIDVECLYGTWIDVGNHKGFTFPGEATRRFYEQFSRETDDAWKELSSLDRKTGMCSCFLVAGPRGSGKEQATAYAKERIKSRFPGTAELIRTTNVAAQPESLVQSELFGHWKGGFTGATEEGQGIFRNGKLSIVVLDEFVGGSEQLQASLQAALLRLLQFGRFRKIGAEPKKSKKKEDPTNTDVSEAEPGSQVDSQVAALKGSSTQHSRLDEDNHDEVVRALIIATTNELSIIHASPDGSVKIRPDLLARFKHQYELPPLRERPEEILPTFVYAIHTARERLANKATATYGADQRWVPQKEFDQRRKPEYICGPVKLEPDALKFLLCYHFPENFRQLHGAAEKIARQLPNPEDVIPRELLQQCLTHGRIDAKKNHTNHSGSIAVRLRWIDCQGDFQIEQKWSFDDWKELLGEWTRPATDVDLHNRSCGKARELAASIDSPDSTAASVRLELTQLIFFVALLAKKCGLASGGWDDAYGGIQKDVNCRFPLKSPSLLLRKTRWFVSDAAALLHPEKSHTEKVPVLLELDKNVKRSGAPIEPDNRIYFILYIEWLLTGVKYNRHQIGDYPALTFERLYGEAAISDDEWNLRRQH